MSDQTELEQLRDRLERAESALERVRSVDPYCDITTAAGPVRVVRLSDLERALSGD